MKYELRIMKNDSSATIQELREIIKEFRRKRNWTKAKLKHLIEALVVEAGELQEVFLWRDDQEIEKKLDKKTKEKAVSELIDVIWYGLAIAEKLEIDFWTEFKKVHDKNDKRFPVEKFKNKKDWEEIAKTVRKLK
jgi:NTP pyrophosphatase (non-canonical NTP hydrolase)